jgi:hypothetical protein
MGVEPITYRLRSDCSTLELRWLKNVQVDGENYTSYHTGVRRERGCP